MSSVTVTEERVYVVLDPAIVAQLAVAEAEAAADRAEAATPGFYMVPGHGVWESTYSFARNNLIVEADGDEVVTYFSLIDDNLNNDPATSPEAWAELFRTTAATYTDGLTANIPDGETFGLRLQADGETVGYLEWSATNAFRIKDASGTVIATFSQAGALSLLAGLTVTGNASLASGAGNNFIFLGSSAGDTLNVAATTVFGGGVSFGPTMRVPVRTVANRGSPTAGNIAWITDAAGGATFAGADGTNWRKITLGDVVT